MSSFADGPSGCAVDVPRLPPGYLPRERLLLLLDAAAVSQLVVVRGPAGGGKTALLADWSRRRSHVERIVWVALDSTARTADDFWEVLARTLSSAGFTIHGEGPALIAAELNGQSTPVCLVIDNFHVLLPAVEPEIARFAALLRRGRIVVSTRRMTLLESDIQSVQSHVAAITAEELAFTVEEVGHLFKDQHGQDHSVDTQSLQRTTGGHTLLTRLVIASERSSVMADASRLTADWVGTLFSTHQMEPALLIAQSPVVDETLARAIIESASAGELLSQLTQDGLGVRDSDGYFRYHELVAVALKIRAEVALTQASRQRACSIAADYLSGIAGHAVAVFRLLAEAGRTTELWPHAARNFSEVMSNTVAVRSVLNSLPLKVVSADGTLGAMAAMIQSLHESSPSVGLLDTAAVAFDELKARPAPKNQEEAYFRGAAILGLLRATCRYDDAAAYADHLERTTTELDPATRLRLGPVRHSVLVGAASTHTLAGNLYDAERVLDALESEHREHGVQRRHVQRAFILAMRGEVLAASALIDTRIGQAPDVIVWAERFAIAQAAILLEREQAQAARNVLKAIEPNLTVLEDWPYALVVTARTHIAIDARVGIEDIDRLLRLHGRRPIAPGVRDLLDSAVADLSLAAGDVQRAVRIVSRRSDRDIAMRLTAARIGLINGDDEAVEDLRKLVRQEAVWPRLRAQALLLLSVHLHRAGRHENAHDLLRRALLITREHRIRLIHSLIPRSELESIAAGAGVDLPQNVNASNPLEETLTPVGLTKREEALLERLATTATLREIAATEFVTLSTIKSQATSIYRKLGIGSRTEAVEVARRRGILI